MKRMWSKNELKSIANNQVKSLVEGGGLDNAKPIYCHPIHIENSTAGQNNYHLTMLIFTNDGTPFNAVSFAQWLDDLLASLPENDEVQVLVSGGIKSADGTKIVIASYLWDNADSMGIAGLQLDGSLVGIQGNNFNDLIGPNALFKDAVNKIN